MELAELGRRVLLEIFAVVVGELIAFVAGDVDQVNIPWRIRRYGKQYSLGSVPIQGDRRELGAAAVYPLYLTALYGYGAQERLSPGIG